MVGAEKMGGLGTLSAVELRGQGRSGDTQGCGAEEMEGLGTLSAVGVEEMGEVWGDGCSPGGEGSWPGLWSLPVSES